MEAKIEWKLTWHCCICCNPANRRVDFEDSWLIKSSFITKDEMKACQLTRTKHPQKKKKKKIAAQKKERQIKFFQNDFEIFWLTRDVKTTFARLIHLTL
jgi:hypothetical protein